MRTEIFKGIDFTNILLWTIYIALLVVLLPHTAWAFSKFEPAASQWVAWAAAFAFESAIAALTHKLTGVIEQTARIRKPLKRFTAQYLNAYALGLYVAVGVSALANLAHAVEYGQTFVIFDDYSIPKMVYSAAFGGVLPFTSLLFARILANVQYTEFERDEELDTAKKAEREAKREVAQLRQQLSAAEEKFAQVQSELEIVKRQFAEIRPELEETKDKLAEAEEAAKASEALFTPDKRERILAVQQKWPALKNSAIAVLTDSSPSYVSETLNGRQKGGEDEA